MCRAGSAGNAARGARRLRTFRRLKMPSRHLAIRGRPARAGRASRRCAPQKFESASGSFLFQPIFMMKSSQNVLRSNLTIRRQLVPLPLRFRNRLLCGLRYSWAEAGMRPAAIVMSPPLTKDSAQMPLTHRNHMIQACTPNCAHQTLTISIRLGRLNWCAQHLQTKTA